MSSYLNVFFAVMCTVWLRKVWYVQRPGKLFVTWSAVWMLMLDNNCMLPVLLYGCKYWIIIDDMMETVETWSLRKMLRMLLTEKKTFVLSSVDVTR